MTNSWENKRILFMGDSITEMGGWVKVFNEIMKPSFFVNIAVSGARWADNERTVYGEHPYSNGEYSNTIGNQLETILRGKDATHFPYSKIPDYDEFDIIIIAAGTNDSDENIAGLYENRNAVINSQFVSADGKVIPLEKVDRKIWSGIMRYVYEKLRKLYPSAKIFYCTPIQAEESIRNYLSIKAKRDFIIEICERLSDVSVIDTFHCGICGIFELPHQNGRDLIDGLHPNQNGEIKIARYNAKAVIDSYL